ncbi:hypothetical protein HPB50_024503 [Hyalomma asiaticum]|uniref:Uncharacterized protein n=1 Tax=Hyalomma asiaticum TaxID=266040 RepID=A0ACB7TMP3_HYAAI|nr:hypothetical protein HPB50_024503 [Hyalomma asiaticum]
MAADRRWQREDAKNPPRWLVLLLTARLQGTSVETERREMHGEKHEKNNKTAKDFRQAKRIFEASSRVSIPIPRCIRAKFEVAPVPRNAHPVHNEGRRKARAVAILKQIQKHEIEASFVDAAKYCDGKTFAVVVVDSSGKTSNCASIRTSDPEVAEQAAIALALLDGRGSEIDSDSKTAVIGLFRRVESPSKLLVF